MLWRLLSRLFSCQWGHLTTGDDPLLSEDLAAEGWVIEHTGGPP